MARGQPVWARATCPQLVAPPHGSIYPYIALTAPVLPLTQITKANPLKPRYHHYTLSHFFAFPKFSMLSLANHLTQFSRETTAYVGIGNRLRGDDACGPMIIDAIAQQISSPCFDVGCAPENFLEKILLVKPECVVLIDAVNMNSHIGKIELYTPDKLKNIGDISTHALSLQMTSDYLTNRRPLTIFLIGIQPETTALGAQMSPPVLTAVAECSRAIIDLYSTDR